MINNKPHIDEKSSLGHIEQPSVKDTVETNVTKKRVTKAKGKNRFQCNWPGCGRIFNKNMDYLNDQRGHTKTPLRISVQLSKDFEQYKAEQRQEFIVKTFKK